MKQDYKKMKIVLRGWLEGRGYYKALAAMNFAEKKHNGTRKDGSPEFSHQVSQALYLITIIDCIQYPEDALCVVFLHDIIEDKNVSYKQLKKLFGKRVAKATRRMSKFVDGVRIPDDIYYSKMENCPIVTITKPIDRVHNLMTMLKGFKPEKQVTYVEETLAEVIPVLKAGRRNFPRQTSAYENIKFVMTNQIQLYDALNENVVKSKK